MASASTAEWNARFDGAGFPYGAVNSIKQVFQDPQVRHRGMEAEVEHQQLGTVKQAGTTQRLNQCNFFCNELFSSGFTCGSVFLVGKLDSLSAACVGKQHRQNPQGLAQVGPGRDRTTETGGCDTVKLTTRVN